MKKGFMCLVVLLVLIGFTSCASAVTVHQKNATPDMLIMETVMDVEGKTQGELYIAANEWAVKTFNKANSVIEFSDKEAGKIAGKYVTTIHFGLANMVMADVKTTMIIEVKDGRYRAILSDPYYDIRDTAASGSGPLKDSSALALVRSDWTAVLASLEQAMKSKAVAW